MRLLYHVRATYVDEPLAFYRIHAGMSTVRYSDKAIAEFYHSLAKLRALDAAAGGQFAGRIENAAAVVEYSRAKQHLAAGDLAAARRSIAPLRATSAKAITVYLATFLPPRLWLALRPLWARGTFR
jgi:hypothetical protein